MAGFDAVAEAFVRLRPKAAADFESDATSQIGAVVGRVAENAALIFASKKIFDVGKAGIAELGQAAAVDAQTFVQLKNLGNTVSITREQVDAYGQSMLNLAGFDDEAARSAANVLLRFGAIHDQGSLTRVGNDAADLAVAMGTDLPSAAETLGRALNNPEKAARLLKPAIGSLTDEQTKSIKAFQDSGNVAGAQGVILDAVEAKVKGTAAAYGDTLPAQLKKAQENLTNLKAALVSGVAPALELTAKGASFLTEKFQAQPEVLQQVEGGLLLVGGGLGALVRPAADVLKLLDGLKTRREASAAATAVDTASTDANTVATEANTVAVGAEAVAMEGEAVAAEGAAVANAGFLASLGPIAIAAAAVGIAIAGITSSGEHLSIDVRKFAGASDQELLKVAHTMQSAFGGSEFQDFVNRLRDGGTEGVGALQRLRDIAKAAGEDTSVYDKALGQAKASQDNLTTSTQAGTDALGEFSNTASDTSALAKQAEYAQNFASAVQAAKDKLQSLSDLASGAPGSDIANQRAQLAVGDSQQRAADAQAKLNDARAKGDPKAIATAERDLQRATLDTKQSVLDAASANAKYVEAQDALNGKLDDAKDKAVLAHDSLAFFAQQAGGPIADDLKPYVDELQKVVDLQNELAGFKQSDAPGTPVVRSGGFGGPRAGGGDLYPGTSGTVGETGMEGYEWPIGGLPRIIPGTGQRAVTQRGGDTNLHFHVNAATDVAGVRQAANEIAWRLQTGAAA